MMSSSIKFLCIFKIKFPTKRIFRIVSILRINGMAPFCNLFIELFYRTTLQWYREQDVHGGNCRQNFSKPLPRTGHVPAVTVIRSRPGTRFSRARVQSTEFQLKRAHLLLQPVAMITGGRQSADESVVCQHERRDQSSHGNQRRTLGPAGPHRGTQLGRQ